MENGRSDAVDGEGGGRLAEQIEAMAGDGGDRPAEQVAPIEREVDDDLGPCVSLTEKPNKV